MMHRGFTRNSHVTHIILKIIGHKKLRSDQEVNSKLGRNFDGDWVVIVPEFVFYNFLSSSKL